MNEKNFESKEDMSKYKLFGGSGKVTINEEQNEEQNP